MNMDSNLKVLKDMFRIPANIDTKKPLSSLRFVTIDTETTGFRSNMGDKVLSIGAVVLEEGKVNEDKTFYELVNPNRGIPETIIKLTGITEQMIIDKPNLLNILPYFFSWIEDSVLVGHVIEFDISFLNQCMNPQCNIKQRYKCIDTRNLIISLFPHFTNCSLEEICCSLGIPTHNRHNALADAVMAAKIFEFSLKELARRRVYTLEDLLNFIRERQYFSSALPQISI